MAPRARKIKVNIEKVNALAELDRAGIKYIPTSENEVKLKCVVHEDANPSLCLNIKKNVWICQSAECKAQGDIVSLLAHYYKTTRDIINLDLDKRYGILDKKTLNPELVENFHKEIWSSGPLLKALYDRGVTEEMIRTARLGYFGGRITIPIYDRDGNVVNIRRYLPGAPGPEKMKNTPGYGEFHLYQDDQIDKYDDIWVCGGEIKALVGGALLNKHNIGVVAGTAGEGAWTKEICERFKGKRVWICLDVDKGGRVGVGSIGGYLFYHANSIHVIKLPLDIVKYPKGDLNDYIGQEKAKDTDLIMLMKSAEQWYPPEQVEENDTEKLSVLLAESTEAKYVGKKLSLPGIVSSLDTDPYLVAKEVMCKCDKNQPNCAWCPIKSKEPNIETGYMTAEVKSTSQGILRMVNAPEKEQHEAIRESLKIPVCKVVEFVTKTNYNVVEVRLSPQLNITNESSKNVTQTALIVGNAIEMNTPYVFEGRLYPHPRTQKAILLLDKVEEGEDSLASYKPEAKDLEPLKIFQPKEWTMKSIVSRLEDIYSDFEANVTRIFNRQDLHMMIDLCYHSALNFKFDERETKGWVNILIAGDSSQGKTETCERLCQHYKLGEKVECKNSTVAGLLGGLHQVGTRWFVSWGVIPTHDRRLVILEEIGGTDPGVLTKLTDMRSSGIADLAKIYKSKAYARTRIIFTSNPRSGRDIAAHTFGIEVIKDLLQRPEDIRRLDAALIVSSKQVRPEEINQLMKNRPTYEHKYTSPLCQSLILWVWTRQVNQVEFMEGAQEAILEYATKLTNVFSDAIPLVDRGTIRHKLAKLSVALAGRTFSCSDDMLTIRVHRCHVEFVYEFLTRIYSDSVFGYKDFSRAQIHANKILDPEVVKNTLVATRHPRDLIEHMLYTDEITLVDLCDWCDTDKDTAQKIISCLVRKHAILRSKRFYIKTSEFINLLKELKDKDLMKLKKEMKPVKEEF